MQDALRAVNRAALVQHVFCRVVGMKDGAMFVGQQDGAPKRIEYQGRWYGAAPPTWFWISFGLALLLGGAFSCYRGVRRLVRVRPPPSADLLAP